MIPDEIAKQQAAIDTGQREMAAQAAYQMLCGDFGELSSPEWVGRASMAADRQGFLYRLLYRAASSLVGGF